MSQDYHRGDIVICNVKGDYGKPRPALVIQTDYLNPTHSSLILSPITSTLMDASILRLHLEPAKHLGLKKTSQIMIDKITTIQIEKIKKKVGHLNNDELRRVDEALKLILDLH